MDKELTSTKTTEINGNVENVNSTTIVIPMGLFKPLATMAKYICIAVVVASLANIYSGTSIIGSPEFEVCYKCEEQKEKP